MDALSKQLDQASVFGEDADVIYLHSCDLNTQFDLTVPSLQFFTAECGLRPFNFFQFFGGEASGSVIVPQYSSSKITVFVWGKNTILKFLGNTK